MLFLGKDFYQVVALEKEGHLLRAHSSNEAVGGNLAKFDGFDQIREESRHLVYPRERGEVTCSLVVDPIASLEMVGKVIRFHGMLEMMIYLLVLLITWEFISNVGRFFYSLSSRSHRSFILV